MERYIALNFSRYSLESEYPQSSSIHTMIRKMWFLPYEKYTIKTSLPPERVKQRLMEGLGPKPPIRFFEHFNRPYHGQMEGYEFRIVKSMPWWAKRPHYVPIIKGEILSDINGSFVKLAMYPKVSDIFIAILLVVLGAIFFLFFPLIDLFGIESYLCVIGLAPLIYTVFVILFKINSSEAEYSLRKLIRGEYDV